MGKTEGKRYATKQKESEKQLPKRDYKEALLMDMKSKIESIWYRVSGLTSYNPVSAVRTTETGTDRTNYQNRMFRETIISYIFIFLSYG